MAALLASFVSFVQMVAAIAVSFVKDRKEHPALSTFAIVAAIACFSAVVAQSWLSHRSVRQAEAARKESEHKAEAALKESEHKAEDAHRELIGMLNRQDETLKLIVSMVNTAAIDQGTKKELIQEVQKAFVGLREQVFIGESLNVEVIRAKPGLSPGQ